MRWRCNGDADADAPHVRAMMRVLALINNSRNSFQNKMGGQKSAFFEISIEIKSAQPVSCSDEAELVGRPGASDAHAELQQALSGLRPGLTRLISPATAPL